MAKATTMQSDEAGPSTGFQTSQDFIAFADFGDDEEEQEEEDASRDTDSHPGAELEIRLGNKRKEPKSSKTNGKKRKVDDRIELEGKSKREKKRELARGTPWCVEVDFESCLNQADVLHDELMAFADWISPTPEEHETRKLVIQLIRKAIVNQWPDADVHAFGSQSTQLYMPQGDIDLVVVSQKMDDQRRETVLRNIAACLRRNNLATDVQVIAKAKVPIVKFVCTYGKYKVDISLNRMNGVDASHFVQDWLHRCPALRPLIMAAKLLLSQRGMSEVFSGGLGSYSVICLAISHVQMHPRIQRGEIDPARNLGVLFLEFLELYGKNFGYDDVGISITGRGKYFRKAARGWKDDRRPFMLSIEDPGDASNDISKGSFSILNVRQAFGGAFDIMTAVMCQGPKRKEKRNGKNGRRDEDQEAREALVNTARLGESDKDPDSLLGNIIGVNREMIKARKDISQLWQSGTLQYKLGKAAPALDPVPITSSHSSRRERAGPPPPREPKATRKEERKRAKDRAKDGANGKEGGGKVASTTSRGIEMKRRGSHEEPIIVLDDSSDAHRQGRRDNGMKRTLEMESEESPAVDKRRRRDKEEEEEDDAEADTRYSNGKKHNAKRVSRLDEFAKVASKTFIVDESGSEDEQGDTVSAEEGEIVEAPSSKKRKANGRNEVKKQRKHDYWEKKGNAVGRSISISDSDDEDQI
ncbi:hypothetical protein CBS101457_004023 [Exobasidium rhododendri]|nr:hypothetical protein CBS101457_004023 [Exobasidium rhododendri]